MKAFLIPAYYLSWHYTTAFAHILAVYRNIVFFSYNFFSIKLLFKTIFQPFRSRSEAGSDEKDREMMLVTIVVGLVGFLVRIATILCGLLSFILTFVFWTAVFIFWIVLPFLSLGLFAAGLISFFQ